MTITLTSHAEVSAVLADPHFDVLAAPVGPHGLAWLRGTVSRFSRGEVHRRRRALAVAALATVSPEQLRVAARTLAGGPAMEPRNVPVSVLAGALGADRPVAAAVATITPGYFGGTVSTGQSAVDDSVLGLVEAFGGAATESTAARIGLLVQAHDATSRLVSNVLASRATSETPLAAALAESLRHDPPVPVMRRECLVSHDRPGAESVVSGSLVILDLAAANRDPAIFADPDQFDPHRPRLDDLLTFGAGSRACPGRDHALSLATGTVEGVLGRA